ncbi:glycoside hydrolase [Pelagophyceae sp. CCMP2097]|nr:glycoside hydrolase [Pelagophyceae sp. CCMP2097]
MFSLAALRSSFPPSASLFAAPGPLSVILAQLRSTASPFVVELDPYLAWRQWYYDISLDYALMAKREAIDAPQFVDDGSGHAYWNLFDAMLDAVRWALARESFGDLEVVVGAVGWPSGIPPSVSRDGRLGYGDSGNGADVGATVFNAAMFNSRLAHHVGACDAIASPPQTLHGGCVNVYIHEATDSGAGVSSGDGMDWGLCSSAGRLKYSLQSGNALASRTRGSDEPGEGYVPMLVAPADLGVGSFRRPAAVLL